MSLVCTNNEMTQITCAIWHGGSVGNELQEELFVSIWRYVFNKWSFMTLQAKHIDV